MPLHPQFRSTGTLSRHRTQDLPPARSQDSQPPPPAEEKPQMGNPRYVPRKKQTYPELEKLNPSSSSKKSAGVQGQTRLQPTNKPSSPRDLAPLQRLPSASKSQRFVGRN